jgi:hypothetical protein
MVGAVSAQTHADPVGDTPGPDINSVVIAHDSQRFTVHVRLANRAALEENEIVQMDLDTDGKLTTGEEGEDLYAVLAQGETPEVLVWQGDDYVETTRATAAFRSDGAHLTIPREFVSGTVKVSVQALGEIPGEAEDTPPRVVTDDAPDSGVYTHVVGRAALQRSTVTYSPAQPRAGRVFRVRNVTLQLAEAGTVKPTSIVCSATLAGKRLKPASPCAWRLARTAKGKALRVSISALVGVERYALPAQRFVVR